MNRPASTVLSRSIRFISLLFTRLLHVFMSASEQVNSKEWECEGLNIGKVIPVLEQALCTIVLSLKAESNLFWVNESVFMMFKIRLTK